MPVRWRIILPVVGLLLFAAISVYSVRWNRQLRNPRYFYWSSIRLDANPQASRDPVPEPCREANHNCIEWEPGVWIDPGWMTQLLGYSAFPAFILRKPIVHGFARVGVSEVTTFMVSMPILLGAWYYFAGWLLDRWRLKRKQNSIRVFSPAPPPR